MGRGFRWRRQRAKRSMSPDLRSMPSAITARRGCISFATPPTLPLKALFPNCSPVNHLLPPDPAADPPYLRGLNDPQRQAVLTTEGPRSEEHKSELQSLMRISYAVF